MRNKNREERSLDFVLMQVAIPRDNEIKIEEYNIFSEEGKLAFAALKLSSASYYPIKTYKELATDPLNQITSALGKMQEGEGGVVQILAAPSDAGWRGAGKGFVSKTKEAELSPKNEGKSVPDPKKMEAVENKVS